MTMMPPWMGLLLCWLLLGAAAAWVLQRGLNKRISPAQEDMQAQLNRRIHQQHLGELDRALSEGRLDVQQHRLARDELLRLALSDAAKSSGQGPAGAPVSWQGIVPGLLLLSALSYWQLGSSHTWWTPPLSQQVQITATTPDQLAEQTRVWLQATQQRPEDAKAWLTLARLQAAQHAYAPAEQALARVLALSPEPDLWIERAQMKALSAGGVFTGEPWQWIQQVLREQPQHLNALVLAGSAALSDSRPAAAQSYWQQALSLVPADSDAATGLQQALARLEQVQAKPPLADRQGAAADRPSDRPSDRPLIAGEVRIAPGLQSQITPGATLFVYALAEDGPRRPVAIWRGTPTTWPQRFALSDSMGMGAPPLLSALAQVRLVARISPSGAAQRQEGDWQVELPGVQTGVEGVVLNFVARSP